MFYSTLFITCKIIIIYIIQLRKPRFREVQQPVQTTQLINSKFWAKTQIFQSKPGLLEEDKVWKVHRSENTEVQLRNLDCSIYFVSDRKLLKIMKKEMSWVFWVLSTQVPVPFLFLYYAHPYLYSFHKPTLSFIYTLPSYEKTSLINST